MSYSPTYRLMHFTTPEELGWAAAFDTRIFSENRVGAAGDETVQPTVDTAFYERLIANGGHAFGLVAETDHRSSEIKIVTLGAVALHSDATATEPGLRHMGPEATYMLVLATDKGARGQGLGAATLEVAIDIAKHAGKHRMDASLHPTNEKSQKAFYRAGFIALGVQSNYYPLDGKNGMRFIAVRDDLTNERWAQENTRPLSAHPLLSDTLNAPEETSMTTMETELNSIFTAAMDAGLCITSIERSKADPRRLIYSYARFTGDQTLLPRIMFPYDTLADSYRHAQINREGPWQPIHELLLNEMDGLAVMNVPFPELAPIVLASEVAENKRLFIDWLNDYQKYLAEPVTDKTPLPYPNAFITARNDLYDALLVFLSHENESLRSLLSNNPLAAWDLTRRFTRIPDLGNRYSWDTETREQYITHLEGQNKALYRIASSTTPAQKVKDGLTRLGRTFGLVR